MFSFAGTLLRRFSGLSAGILAARHVEQSLNNFFPYAISLLDKDTKKRKILLKRYFEIIPSTSKFRSRSSAYTCLFALLLNKNEQNKYME